MEKIGNGVEQPFYIEVKIVSGGTFPYNTNAEIVKQFEEHGFSFKGEPITQINDDGIAWTFMCKNNNLVSEDVKNG